MRSGILVALGAMMLAAIWPDQAHAYFGPGAGVTMLGALWGVIAAIGFAIFAFLAWPVRALLRRRKRNAQAAPGVSGAATARDAGR